jgi:Protein of unknown function (DUF2793)
MTMATHRLSLPFIVAGQAQKEVTHNEALMRLDALVQPCVESIGDNVPPVAPQLGACWIVGTAPRGAWADEANNLACWTSGGWRFVAAKKGMTVWSIPDGVSATYLGTEWSIGRVPAKAVIIDGKQIVGPQSPGIAAPANGSLIDAEARVAIGQILSVMRNHGLIAV